ncbi:putative NADH:ubiquinone reductase (H(+)-translocating) [Helianthus anomalus]
MGWLKKWRLGLMSKAKLGMKRHTRTTRTTALLAAGAPLLTIAHLFSNNLFRKDNFTYFCQILLLLSTAGTISMCFDSSEQERFDASESIVLIPLPARSMLFMISAYDSIAMYLSWALAFEPDPTFFFLSSPLFEPSTSLKRFEKLSENGSEYGGWVCLVKMEVDLFFFIKLKIIFFIL